MLTLTLFALALTQSANGATLFESRCATCHLSNGPRTPTLAALKQKTPQSIIDSLTTGVMRQQGSEMTDAEKRAPAEYLGTPAPGGATATTTASAPTAGACASA